MQLVEIIQLVLLGFIAISLSIFLFSYVGYRSKNKNPSSKMVENVKNASKSSQSEIKSIDLPEEKESKLPSSQNSKIETNSAKVDKNKFEVFRPSNNKLKPHSPKIIKSDISTETNKKK